MWPWEHAALGYLLYSLGLHGLRREAPSAAAALVVLFGTQLPDLVDKPLSWGLGLFPTGFAVAHSVFIAIPVGVLALVVAVRADRTRTGSAFVLGYWSHLVADVVNPMRVGGTPDLTRVMWPVVEATPYETDYGLRRGWIYLTEFLVELPSTDATSVVALYLFLPLSALVLWLGDGAPGYGAISGWLRSKY